MSFVRTYRSTLVVRDMVAGYEPSKAKAKCFAPRFGGNLPRYASAEMGWCILQIFYPRHRRAMVEILAVIAIGICFALERDVAVGFAPTAISYKLTYPLNKIV